MRRPTLKLLRPVVPVIVAGLALILPVLATPDPRTVGTAGSVVAKAAQAGGTTGGDRRYPVGGGAMETARAIAIAHWGANPCGGVYTIAWVSMDVGTNATASWRNPTDAWNNAGANFDCRIELNTQAAYDFAKLCTVLTHEIGHLVGRQHDPNPGQLMSAYYTTPLPACENREPADPAAPAGQPARSGPDGVDIVATDEPRRTLRKKAPKTVRRCVLRKTGTAAKRVKRCQTVKVTATKAARGARKA